MDKNEIVEKLAKDCVVEVIVKNYCGKLDNDLQDLCQDIYLDLLLKDEKLVVNLYNLGHIKFFITKMVRNNVFSGTSPFYTKYKKPNYKSVDIDEIYGLY